MFTNWISITNFGSAAVTIPTAAALTCWLLAARAWRTAFAWVALFGAGCFVVAISKILFLGWGIGIRAWDFTGVSGHTMFAATVYPVMFWLVTQRFATPWRVAGMALGMAASVAVGVSRVALSAHSVSEIVAGWIVGFAVAIAFAWLTRHDKAPNLKTLPMAASLFVLVMALHGEQVPTQRWITELSVALAGRDHEFRRASWLAHPHTPAHAPAQAGKVAPQPMQ